ncbi:diguanylate cyclase [Rhodobacterales bacterium]|nr:diguanylate cyclase [Rhodobacterales bacterium]
MAVVIFTEYWRKDNDVTIIRWFYRRVISISEDDVCSMDPIGLLYSQGISSHFQSGDDLALSNIVEMMQHSVALIGVYDEQERLRFTNESFRRAYFILPGENLCWQQLMRRNFAANRGTIIRSNDIDAWIASVRSRRGKNKVRTYESDLHCGAYIWVTETMLPNGWIIYVGADVSELRQSERWLRQARDEAVRASTTDELTGVSNRRHIIGQLERMLPSGPEKSHKPSEVAVEAGGTVGLLDIDHFKKINDTYGHQAGDEVLVTFARIVRETIKLRDAFGRVGGEEFLILFPGQSVETAVATLEQLSEAFSEVRPIGNAPDLKISFCVGLTHILSCDDTSKIFSRCDAALYEAKERGRNQLKVFG